VCDGGTWNAEHRRYWTDLADHYDSLYSAPWAARENVLVARRLKFLSAMSAPLVVDLAAGTGLGLDLVRRSNASSTYVGVDLTPAMLAAGHVSPSLVSAMERVALRSGSADAVICLFTSCSFAYDTQALFLEVARLLRPGGVAYLSLLSDRALSRLRHGSRSGRYHTRGDNSGGSVPVRRMSSSEARSRLSEAGLILQRCQALNALSGFAEVTQLWSLGEALGNVVPWLSHSIELTVRKLDPR
jgi:SAM-dependent methyltransferase